MNVQIQQIIDGMVQFIAFVGLAFFCCLLLWLIYLLILAAISALENKFLKFWQAFRQKRSKAPRQCIALIKTQEQS